MKIKNNKKGVTLVSLVVTIIVLIILAGVSIGAIWGENGIITVAKKAKENLQQAQIEEQTELNELYISMQEEGIAGGISYDAIAKLIEFKRVIAKAITDKGVNTTETDSAETMANNIANIQSGTDMKSQIITSLQHSNLGLTQESSWEDIINGLQTRFPSREGHIIAAYGYEGQTGYSRALMYNTANGNVEKALYGENLDNDITSISIDSQAAVHIEAKMDNTYDVFYSSYNADDKTCYAGTELGINILADTNITRTMFSQSTRELAVAIPTSIDYIEVLAGWDAYGTDFRAIAYDKSNNSFKGYTNDMNYILQGSCMKDDDSSSTTSIITALVDGDFTIVRLDKDGNTIVENKRVSASSEILRMNKGTYGNVQPNLYVVLCTKVY